MRKPTNNFTSKLISRTYQPKGSSQAPAKVPQLVSGVLPANRIMQSTSSTGKDSRKK